MIRVAASTGPTLAALATWSATFVDQSPCSRCFGDSSATPPAGSSKPAVASAARRAAVSWSRITGHGPGDAHRVPHRTADPGRHLEMIRVRLAGVTAMPEPPRLRAVTASDGDPLERDGLTLVYAALERTRSDLGLERLTVAVDDDCAWVASSSPSPASSCRPPWTPARRGLLSPRSTRAAARSTSSGPCVDWPYGPRPWTTPRRRRSTASSWRSGPSTPSRRSRWTRTTTWCESRPSPERPTTTWPAAAWRSSRPSSTAASSSSSCGSASQRPRERPPSRSRGPRRLPSRCSLCAQITNTASSRCTCGAATCGRWVGPP